MAKTPPPQQSVTSLLPLQPEEEQQQSGDALRSSVESFDTHHVSNNVYATKDSLREDACSETKEEGYHSNSDSTHGAAVNGNCEKTAELIENPNEEGTDERKESSS